MSFSKLKNKKIAILWFWKEGNSSLEFLLKIWINPDNISIIDKHKTPDFLKSGVRVISWENYLDNLDDFDLIFKSPWISPYNPKISPYKKKLISNTEIFFNNYQWRVIWITWTKGKSTISTLTYEILKEYWYNVKIVWNIWKPVLDEIDILWWENYDYIIYELSSYMLEKFSPELFIWVLNNIFPDHLDWHNNFENYKKSKENILKNSLNQIDWRILNKKTKFKTKLEWEHNKKNIAVVEEICKTIWIKDFSRFENTLKEFNWLAHRLENIWTFSWIRFIDDAISTTPESTIEAIKTYNTNIWTIFLWWTNRWYKFDELVKYLEKYNIKNIVLFPDSWDKILSLLNKEGTEGWSILETSSMKKAIQFAYKNTWTWKICLLSTASPSYSLWKNFEEKWDDFKSEIIKNYM